MGNFARSVRLALHYYWTVGASIFCALVVALLGCVLLGVITRTLGDPFSWTDELSRFLMVWLAVFGWVLASRKHIHVRIRYFQDLLPATMRRSAELAIQLESRRRPRHGPAQAACGKAGSA